MQDLTILIPTHNRPCSLFRLLTYLEEIEFPIVVVDSSSERYTHKHLGLDLKYFHFPDMDFFEKLPRVLKEVNTEFIAYLADDDFVAKDAIRSCLTYLKNNPTCVTCIGQEIGYRAHRSGSLKFQLRGTYEYLIKSKRAENNDIFLRLKNILDPYSQIIWACHRTSVFKEFFNLDFTWLYTAVFFERLFTLYFAISGEVKFLPIFYGGREFDNIQRDEEKFSYQQFNKAYLSSDTDVRKEIGFLESILSTKLQLDEDFDNEKSAIIIATILNKHAMEHVNYNMPSGKIGLFLSKYNPDKAWANWINKNYIISNDRWKKCFYFKKPVLPSYSKSNKRAIAEFSLAHDLSIEFSGKNN